MGERLTQFNEDAMTSRRPPTLKPPAYLSKSPPVPAPGVVEAAEDDPLGLDPARYGDWESKGIAVDF